MSARKSLRKKSARHTEKDAAREISYAPSAQSRSGRVVIRLMENVTGRFGLIRRARGYDDEVRAGRDFWDVIADRYGLSLDVVGGSLEHIPKEGPLIVVSNHPYGILDGLMLGHILARTRGNFRILAHTIFRRAPDLDNAILPVSFEGTRAAMKTNLETRKAALEFLAQGGAIGIFPGGTVSTSLTPMAMPMDPGWRTFTAKMIAKSEATVVPIFFDGHNSRLFQIASHLHANLRRALLIKEFRARIDEPVKIVVGAPFAPEVLDKYRQDPKALMEFLRKATYDLSPIPVKSEDYGFEFEEHHRTG